MNESARQPAFVLRASAATWTWRGKESLLVIVQYDFHHVTTAWGGVFNTRQQLFPMRFCTVRHETQQVSLVSRAMVHSASWARDTTLRGSVPNNGEIEKKLAGGSCQRQPGLYV
jgi:hypothetical protein